MTPQQLIDLPYAGSATKQLIKQGDWLSVNSDEERLNWLDDRNVEVLDEDEHNILVRRHVGSWSDGIRSAIDFAAMYELKEKE